MARHVVGRRLRKRRADDDRLRGAAPGAGRARQCSSTSKGTSTREQVEKPRHPSLRFRVRLLRTPRLEPRGRFRLPGAHAHGADVSPRAFVEQRSLRRRRRTRAGLGPHRRRSRWRRSWGMPYREGLVKNRYVGRTFIMPNQGERSKLRAPEAQRDRGGVRRAATSCWWTTRSCAARRAGRSSTWLGLGRRSQGALRLHLAAARCTPCVYGIDMSTRREFVARDRSHAEEVAEQIKARTPWSTRRSTTWSARSVKGQPQIEQMCTACFSGDYPTGDITPGNAAADRERAARARRSSRFRQRRVRRKARRYARSGVSHPWMPCSPSNHRRRGVQ